MAVFDHPEFDHHEGVYFFSDSASGLRAIIGVHSTALGPAAGGTRFWSYENSALALKDVLRLSRAMSYKNAMAGLDHGGGKGVIMMPEGDFNRRALFEAYGRAVETLGGTYKTAEDVGVGPDDMAIIRTQTTHVGGLDHGKAASGDPSPVTAEGVFQGIKTAVQLKMGRDSLEGVRVAIQGLGHVGYYLAEKLHAAGAVLTATDINSQACQRAEEEFGAEIVSTDAIYDVDCDVFAPCALGASINPDTIERIKAVIIGGAANNQLSAPDMAERLLARDILYSPDYVINGGGIINVAAELSGHYDPEWIACKLDELRQTLEDVLREAMTSGRSPKLIADEMAERRIAAKKTAAAA